MEMDRGAPKGAERSSESLRDSPPPSEAAPSGHGSISMRPVAVDADGRQMGIVAKATCGCVGGLALDVPGDGECVATLKAWKRLGWTLARLPLDELPRLEGTCPHARPRRAPTPRAAEPVLVRR